MSRKGLCCFKSRYGVLTLDQSLDCARCNARGVSCVLIETTVL